MDAGGIMKDALLDFSSGLVVGHVEQQHSWSTFHGTLVESHLPFSRERVLPLLADVEKGYSEMLLIISHSCAQFFMV